MLLAGLSLYLLATLGMLLAPNIDVLIGMRVLLTANSRAKINHETEGFVKILADANTDQILGVHMIGPSVGELIGEYCVAMEFSASVEDIALTCHPHLTRSEAGRQAAMGVHGWTMQA